MKKNNKYDILHYVTIYDDEWRKWWPKEAVTKGHGDKGSMEMKEMGRPREAAVMAGAWPREMAMRGEWWWMRHDETKGIWKRRERGDLGKRRRRERSAWRREAVTEGGRGWYREAATKEIWWCWEVVTQGVWGPREVVTKEAWWRRESVVS